MQVGAKVKVNTYSNGFFETIIRAVSGTGDETLVWCKGLSGCYPVSRVQLLEKPKINDKHLKE